MHSYNIYYYCVKVSSVHDKQVFYKHMINCVIAYNTNYYFVGVTLPSDLEDFQLQKKKIANIAVNAAILRFYWCNINLLSLW